MLRVEYEQQMTIEKLKAEKSLFFKKKHLKQADLLEKNLENTDKSLSDLELLFVEIDKEEQQASVDLDNDKREIESHIDSLNNKVEKLEAEWNALNDNFDKNELEISSLNSIYTKNLEQKQAYKDELAQIGNEEFSITQSFNSNTVKQNKLEKTLESTGKKHELLQKKLENTTNNITDLELEIDEISKKIKENKGK